MCMSRVIVLSIFLMINIQDLFSFGMVLIFKTYITNIMTYLMKNMLFQEEQGRKSPQRIWSNQSYPILYRVEGNVVIERKESGISVTEREKVH